MKSPVTKVSKERWLKAQEFELTVWQRRNSRYNVLISMLMRGFGFKNIKVGDDWNSWWYEQFDSYKIIPNRLGNAIELGCGPYTNIRLIWKNRTIDHVVCSDPLASHYIGFKRCWLASEYARRTISLDTHPAEECPFANDYFDLVIMTNVLDHVQDALACLNTAIRITKPTGYLVIGQDLSDEADVTTILEDVGHPILLHHEDIDKHLLGIFEPKLYKILRREEGRNPQAHYGTYLFIGQKLSPAVSIG